MAQFTINQLLIIAKKIINDVLDELQNVNNNQCHEILDDLTDLNERLKYITNNEDAINNCPSLIQEIEYENILSEVLNEQIDFNNIEPF